MENIDTPINPPIRTDENPILTYDKYTEINLNTTNFTLIATPSSVYTIKNRSGNPVYVAFNDNGTTLSGDVDQQLIGGIVGEINTDEFKYTWVRASVENSIISIRPSNTIDPTSDTISLGNAINDLTIKCEEHFSDNANPHEVTKEQVGLGNIPNEKSDNIGSNSSDILATTALTFTLNSNLKNHIDNKDNPHEVTKDQVGLGNVDNYETADHTDLNDCLSTVTNKFVTPAAAHRIAKIATAIAYSTKPQLVIAGEVGEIDENWLANECDYPPNHTVKKDDSHITIKQGLIVSYGLEHKSRISEELTSPIDLAIDVATNGYHYVYVNINPEGFISTAGETSIKPIFDTSRKKNVGDFFNYSECVMYDSEDNPISRVYIAMIVVEKNRIIKVIPTPIGARYICPLGNDLVLSGRFLIDNPYMTKNIKTTAEVLYRNGFAPTEWNDQIGVKASPHYTDGDTTIVVQCGQMGFLACGRESGSSFGSAFTTINTNLRTRIVIERTLF